MHVRGVHGCSRFTPPLRAALSTSVTVSCGETAGPLTRRRGPGIDVAGAERVLPVVKRAVFEARARVVAQNLRRAEVALRVPARIGMEGAALSV